MDFTTTREPVGAIKTSTPGYEGASPVGAGGDFGSAIADILKQRRQVPRPQPRTPQVAVAQQAAPGYVPTMGQAPIQHAAKAQQPATRMRRVRSRTSIPSMLDQHGITYDDVQENQLPDGSWSLDAVYGTLGGNEQAARQRMASLDDQRAGFSSSNPVAAGRQAAGFDGKVRMTQRDKNGKII